MSYIRLRNGDKHYFMQPFDIDIKCIAETLSYINRYTGHVDGYSVAQHSVLVADQLPEELKLAGLLHDAPEFILNDISKPLKALLPDYKRIEAWYHNFFDGELGIQTEHPLIKQTDALLCATEMKSFGFPREDWDFMNTLDVELSIWGPEQSFETFMEVFNKYAYPAGLTPVTYKLPWEW